MGIQGLTKLLSDHAPSSVREQKFESYFGRKVAVDASMHIYQCMIVVGRVGDNTLTNEAGDVTGHLQGMLYRTARMVEAGIKPIYVFDGKPPDMKSGELSKRLEKRTEATEALAQAKESGDTATVEQMSKRTVRVTREHNDEVKRMLRLMGIPIVEAPSEAEAQCAEMCKADMVWAVATEDMDVLTFGTKRVARNLMVPASLKKPVLEFDIEKVLEGLELTMDQFIDMCILLGCDYCDSIRGIGPVSALKLIREHGSIDAILDHIKSSEKSKYQVPEDWQYKRARELFKQPEVISAGNLPDMKWSAPDEAGLIQFLVDEKSFNKDRVQSVIEKLKAAKKTSQQGRLESFFGAAKITSSTLKRKEPEKGKGGKQLKGVLAKKSKGVSKK